MENTGDPNRLWVEELTGYPLLANIKKAPLRGVPQSA